MLPADPLIDVVGTLFRVEANEIYDEAIAGRTLDQALGGLVLLAYDDDLSVRDQLVDAVDHEGREMRQVRADIVQVRAGEKGVVHIRIVDPKVETLAVQSLREFHQRALPQVVRIGLE